MIIILEYSFKMFLYFSNLNHYLEILKSKYKSYYFNMLLLNKSKIL